MLFTSVQEVDELEPNHGYIDKKNYDVKDPLPNI